MIIVNQSPVMEAIISPWVFLVLSCFAAISLFIAILAFQERVWVLGFSLVALALVLGGILCYGLSAKVESGRNRYEYLIDDTVPFAEVAENYDVVGRRGDLWILEDKVDE
jgi:hypothetical protein